jgi:oligopeptide/dipeptide ABC transporter ATP-binding protein
MTKQADERPVLSVSGLDVSFRTMRGEVKAVSDVSFDLKRGEVLALVGESGSGKSVSTRAVMGIVRGNATINARRMELAGHDLLTADEEQKRKLRGRVISLVFQDALSALNPVLSIGDQLGELYRTHLNVSKKEARERSIELLRSVHLASADKRIDDYPHQFSGGMRQRILIASAIALKPEVLIADEPTTALDVVVQKEVLSLIRDIQKEMNAAVVFVTHDMSVHANVADRVGIIYAGRLVEEGPTRDMFFAPKHPYTAHLVASLPRIGDVKQRPALEGRPPNLADPPQGCRFHPRCPLAVDKCRQEVPPMEQVGPDHRTACWRWQDVKPLVGASAPSGVMA